MRRPKVPGVNAVAWLPRCGYHVSPMTVYEKLPGWLKAAIGIGVLLIGPVMVCSLWIWGVQGGITAFVSILVYFMILYVVGVRRYIESK